MVGPRLDLIPKKWRKLRVKKMKKMLKSNKTKTFLSCLRPTNLSNTGGKESPKKKRKSKCPRTTTAAVPDSTQLQQVTVVVSLTACSLSRKSSSFNFTLN